VGEGALGGGGRVGGLGDERVEHRYRRPRERERERRRMGEEKEIEEENIKGSRTLTRRIKERVRASSAEDAAGTDPIALLAGIKKHSPGDCL